jgi:hypothetical protein
MSASGKALPAITYRIDAGSPVIEIYLIDSNFAVRDRGLGTLEGSVPPGIYKVKFKSGAAFIEKLFDLTQPSPTVIGMTLQPGELSFATPVPIDGTASSHPYHRNPAEQLSRKVDRELGTGSQLFVFVRDPEAYYAGDPAESLKLLDTKGSVLLSLVEAGAGEATDTIDSWHGCNVELDPGTYILACDTGGDRRLCMPVVTCKNPWAAPGWQTQVFLFRSSRDKDSQPRPDLREAAMLMAQIGYGFNSSAADHLKWSELARKSLAQLKAFPSPKDPYMRGMISEKFDDPMLGIYAAHCLLMYPDFDRPLLNTIVGNLDNLLGGHPDVDTVKLQLGIGTSRANFENPPMLRSSWATLLDRSVERPEIIPENSLAAHAGSRTWGESAWFIWEEDLKPLLLDSTSPDLLAPLTISEDAVYQYCLDRERGRLFEEEAARQPNLFSRWFHIPSRPKLDLSRFSDSEAARSLGLPRSTVQVAFRGLRAKLKNFT